MSQVLNACMHAAHILPVREHEQGGECLGEQHRLAERK